MSEELDSDFFREAVTDAKMVRETAIENAKDHLEEAFTPQLQSMLSQTIQQEMEGEEEMPEEEEEDEVELDLTDVGEEPEDGEEEEGEDQMEEVSDQKELNMDEVMEFLEAATTDDRHSDPDTADDVSDDNPHMYGDEDLETAGVEDGYEESETTNEIMDDVDQISQQLEEEAELEEAIEDEMVDAFIDLLGEEEDVEKMDMEDYEDEEEDEDYEDMSVEDFADEIGVSMEDLMGALDEEGHHDEDYEEMEETVFDVDLNEFGVNSDVTQPARPGQQPVSDPYDTAAGTDEPGNETSDINMEYDPGYEAGTSRTEDLEDQEPMTEGFDLSDIELETEDYGSLNEDRELREQNQKLREELDKHRQAIEILRNKINETNLINSKLLYTNRLFKQFGLDERQKMKVIEAFDRTKDVREAKLVYSTLAENFNNQDSGSSNIQESSKQKSGKKEKLVEALQGGRSSQKTSGSTQPSQDKKRILNEESSLQDRFKKLANI